MNTTLRKARPEADTAEHRLGDYEVIAELGRGGMGCVYLAQRSGHAGFQRLFAVKVVHEDLIDDPNSLLMLMDEANIASRLHHPNVVPIIDVGHNDSLASNLRQDFA